MNLAGSSIDPAGDPAERTFLEADEARGKLFDEILEQLALCDLFSNPALEPTIFPVYAHRNDAVGIAHDNCVHDLIRWLQKIKARVLSDKSALPPLVRNEGDSSAQRNILANQIRLLPAGTKARLDQTTTSIDKVIVCGSEVLKRYCETKYAFNYIKNVVELCKSLASQPVMTVKSRIEEFVHSETFNDGFHHVLTEIAFLKVRRLRLTHNHGMIPVALDGGHHLSYLSVFGDTDLTLKMKSPTPAAKHALFFKLLEQVFVERKELSKDCKDCYDDVVEELRLGEKGRVSKANFEICFRAKMTKTYYKHWSTFSTALQNGQYVAYAGKLGERIFQIQEKDKEKERRKILRWVSPMAAAPMHGKYHDGDTKRLEGTCDWVIHHEEFLQWHKSEDSAILSLCGSMGMGKTYATSRIIDWVKCSLEGSKYQEALVYFYCIEQDEERSKAKSILRSIVRQVATGPWNRREEMIALDKAVIDIWNKHSSTDQFYDTFDEWKNCLLKILNEYPRATIVLDALDECGPSDRKQLVKIFDAVTTRLSNVKIFVSTRPEPDLLEWLSQHSTISIHNGRTARDIAAFVEEKIAQHDEWPHMSVELKRDMVETLKVKSQGMFLCAQLQMENLQDCLLEADIREGLENLPETLITLYERLYLRPIKPAAKILRDRALRWVMCSLEPLTSDELLFAISQDPEADRIVATQPDLSERFILRSCNHLLLLDFSDNEYEGLADRRKGPPAPVWRLAHQAVAEFFENSACCSQERSGMHYEAGKVCLMILLNTFRDTAVEDKSGWPQLDVEGQKCRCPCRKQPHSRSHLEFRKPLAEYAIHAWSIHVRAHEHRESQSDGRLHQMLQQFLGDPTSKEGSPIYTTWLKHATWTDVHPEWSAVFQRCLYGSTKTMMSPIELACYLGFPKTLAKWLDSASLEQYPRYRAMHWSPWKAYSPRSPKWLESEQPLWWSLVALACAHDEAKIVTLLLDRKPSAPIEPKNPHEIPPFVAAAIGDSVEAAQVLLRHGIDTAMVSDFATHNGHALLWAIYYDSLKVLRLLLKELRRKPVTVEKALAFIQIKDFRSEDAVTMLLDEKIDVNTPLQDGTLLAAAVYMGWESLVARLLGNGADVNIQFEGLKLDEVWNVEEWEPKNALEISVCDISNYVENITSISEVFMGELLMGKGASASDTAVTSFPELLVENGVIASARDVTSITELLIGKGASASATAVAILCRKIDFVEAEDRNHPDETLRGLLRLLLCNLSNPNETCTGRNCGTTSALIEVIRLGIVDHVLLLLERGADANLWVGGSWGDAVTTAFRHTLSRQDDKSKYPTRQIIDALMNAGAKFDNLEGDSLDIALAAASWAGLDTVVPVLLKRGGNPNAMHKQPLLTALGAAAVSDQRQTEEIIHMLLRNGADVNLRLSDQSRPSPVQHALDFPLWLMVDKEMHVQYIKVDKVEPLCIWARSASVLLSEGALWDVDFGQWRICLEIVEPEFSKRNVYTLDKMQKDLEKNRSKLSASQAASDEWKIKDPLAPGSYRRVVLAAMRKVCMENKTSFSMIHIRNSVHKQSDRAPGPPGPRKYN